MQKIIVAIDGFASTGKSSLAKRLAETLNYTYIDSGAMYRAVTYFAIQKGHQGHIDKEKLIAQLDQIEIYFKYSKSGHQTFLNGLNILDIAADIKGNDSARPTPAPVSIAPIKNTSKITLSMPVCLVSNIPENVRGVLEFLIREKTNATVGRMYKAQPVNIQ